MVELALETGIAYTAIILMAIIPVYIGSHFSLYQKQESMSKEDAYMFPLVGSVVLFGLYMVFRLFHKDYINILLSSYFCLFGIFALSATIRPILEKIFPFLVKSEKDKIDWSFVPFWDKGGKPHEVKFDGVDAIGIVIAAAVGIWYVSTKHWIASNILALSFSIQGIALLSLGSYQIGCILLSGLFIYDIFWVFATEVMVTVAKSFDAPVKVLFPKDVFADEFKFSMLGLGDIVIPGVFIALLLRFDRSMATSGKKGSKKSTSFKKTLFNVTYVAYILGLVTTIAVMHTFQAAQPALLYLVPFCIISSAAAAYSNGSMNKLLAFSEEDKSAEKKESSGIQYYLSYIIKTISGLFSDPSSSNSSKKSKTKEETKQKKNK